MLLKRPTQELVRNVSGTAVAEAVKVAEVIKAKEAVKEVAKVERKATAVATLERTQYRVKVRQYMTKPTEPGSSFDFQTKYNNNTPMPMRVMVGEILKETKGMYQMRLHGRPEPSSYCLHCGRPIVHPVSILYGLGPKCGDHWHINPLASEEALAEVMEEIKQKLAAVTWTGWIIKSAVEEWDIIEQGAGL